METKSGKEMEILHAAEKVQVTDTFTNDNNEMRLGNYQISIAFTNGGTPVQAN